MRDTHSSQHLAASAEIAIGTAGLNYTIIHPGGLFDENVRTGCSARTAGPGCRARNDLDLQLVHQYACQHNIDHVAMSLQGGEREIVLGVDDQLLKKAETEGTSRRIPRDDVAALAVAALTSKSADNR